MSAASTIFFARSRPSAPVKAGTEKPTSSLPFKSTFVFRKPFPNVLSLRVSSYSLAEQAFPTLKQVPRLNLKLKSSLRLKWVGEQMKRKPKKRSPSAARSSSLYSSPVMEWQDCRAEIELDVPCSVAYKCYSDRESIPKWMPFISSVKILRDKPDMSRWSLKYEVFGRNVEFSWLACNMKPIPNQKIHWQSLEGLPNSGAVRFYPKTPSSCRVELCISYEVPQILVPVASALKPFMVGLLLNGLQRFEKVAREYEREATTP